MSVHRNWNKKASGGVNPQSHPNVQTYPWIPNNKMVRRSIVRPSWSELVQPHEKGKTWNRSTLSVGASMSSCGQCGAGKAGK